MSQIKTRDYTLSQRSAGGGAPAGGKSLRMALASLGGQGTVSGAVREVATDPTGVIANRQKEKKDLQDLNDRFANYIEKIRYYEVENKRLKTENDGLKAALEKLEQMYKDKYEDELCAARKAIDDTTKAKAEVELKVKGLEDDLKMYKEKYEKEEAEHCITRESLPKLEKAVVERDATIDYLEKSLKALEMETGKYKTEIANSRREMTDLRSAMDGEVVLRVELESQVQSKCDEIEFIQNMYEEKMRILLDNLNHEDFQAEFSSELAAAVRDIRAEYEAINEAQRGADTEGWYKAKFSEMMAASQRAGNDLANSKEESKAMRMKIADLSKEMSKLRAENAALRERIASLEMEQDEMEKRNAAELEEKNSEIAALRAQLANQILELKELMDAKLALDAEICTYRRLLSGEETRMRGGVEAGQDQTKK